MLNWLLKKLLTYKFRHNRLYAWSFGIDERADITVLFEIDGKQGLRISQELMDDYYKVKK